SNGMLAMMRSFEKSYKKTFKKRTAFKKRVVSIGLTFLLGLLLIASVVLVIVGNLLINLLSEYIHLDWFSTLSLSLLRYIVIIALFYSVIAVIYRFGVATHKRMNFFTPGATMATLLCLLSSQIFSFYVDNFNTYNKLYGSIGTVIVVMLWIQINSLFLLLGFELNAGIAVNRDLERKDEEDEDEEP
ncbi:MAG: YihY/virulence factor BrkB family protein, partial [Phaeodactylibacter sp.]|nr:YihY/virulence factor BrkB family protein [Phaeodactylibacter sp.]